MTESTLLHELADAGQSPCLDNLRRGWITGGELAGWIDRGVRGLTSNPSIFQKAISSGNDYDEQFGDLIASGRSVGDAYWDMVTHDIEGALRSEEHTSELQSLMRISYAVFCLKKKKP